ncbi:MAG: hypothetical protein HFE59_08420 [Clostridiales bacterium]|nr:hypothetical protein [Clostridiales bacterium]
MNLCKNLNDIPMQFRQYENRRKEEHIPPNTRNTEKTIEEIKKEIKLENIQTKSPYPNQNTLNLKDKIFIFLIITIFFDIF